MEDAVIEVVEQQHALEVARSDAALQELCNLHLAVLGGGSADPIFI